MQTYVEHGRGSRRTWRQLAELPDGAIYLVPNERMAGHCRQLLRNMGRDPRVVRFATIENFHRFVGARAPAFDRDHVFDDRPWSTRDQEVTDFLRLTVTPYY